MTRETPELPLLSFLVFLPLLGALLMVLLPFKPGPGEEGVAGPQNRMRRFALLVTLLTFVLSLLVLFNFKSSYSGFQLLERYAWIPSLGVSYALGVDGISLALVLLTTFFMPLVILGSQAIEKRLRGYLVGMLILETAILGTLLALDLVLFYLFWELMLAPMYFIIGLWGGKRRIYAALKFVLFTVAGSVLMFSGILYAACLYYEQQNELSFFLPDLLRYSSFTLRQEMGLFLAFGLAFAVKVPVFPLHTWLPDAHVEAPTGGSVILAAVLLKMGVYGFLRFAFPLFPRAGEALAPYLAFLALTGIVFGALMAWAQSDIKKLVAYSSISHLGFCVLGLVALNQVSLTGAVYQMLNHGISTGALFFLVGALYERRHTREMSEFGGLAAKLPRLALVFMVFVLSSMALPATNGFVGEFMILAGSFKVYTLLSALALVGVVLAAVYLLSFYRKVMFGALDEGKNGALRDLSLREAFIFIPLLALVFLLGLYPPFIVRRLEPAVSGVIVSVQERAKMLEARAASKDPLPAPVGGVFWDGAFSSSGG